MSQKELLYLEDAVGHEESIIAMCNESVNQIDDEELISFLNNEISSHTETKQKLMNILEEKANG